MNPPAESKKVAERLKDVKLEVIEGAGHIIFFEKKREVIELIDSFIK